MHICQGVCEKYKQFVCIQLNLSTIREEYMDKDERMNRQSSLYGYNPKIHTYRNM